MTDADRLETIEAVFAKAPLYFALATAGSFAALAVMLRGEHRGGALMAVIMGLLFLGLAETIRRVDNIGRSTGEADPDDAEEVSG